VHGARSTVERAETNSNEQQNDLGIITRTRAACSTIIPVPSASP
jgi:hypothetical protein